MIRRAHKAAGLWAFQIDPLMSIRRRWKQTPQPPPAPDPNVVAKAQTGTNVDTAVANATLNNTNQIGPGGSTTYNPTGGYTDPATGQWVPQYTQTTQLSPLAQALYNSQQNLGIGQNSVQQALLPGQEALGLGAQNLGIGTEQIAGSLLPTAQTLATQAGTSATTPLNFNSTNNSIVQGGPQALNQNATTAAYNAQAGFLDPQWKQQQTELTDQLARQGIPVGSEAYNNALTNFNNSKSQAYNAAANTAVGQGETAATNMFGMALQGQNQNVQQQQLAQQNPLNLLNQVFSGGMAKAA
jgi:hypothetical protein